MRRVLGAMVLAIMLVAASLVLASATADNHDGNGENGDDGKGTTLELRAESVEEVDLDLGKKGFGIGDRLAFTDDVFEDDEEVGSNSGECVFVRIGEDVAWLHCIGTLWLDDKGQLTWQGVVEVAADELPDPFTFAITGGTEDFRSADGEVEIEFTDEGASDLTIHLDD